MRSGAVKVSGIAPTKTQAPKRRPGVRVTLTGQAQTWLTDYLADKGPSLSSVVKQAAEEAGLSLSTLKRAVGLSDIAITSVPGTTQTQWSVNSEDVSKPENHPLAECTCPCTCGVRDVSPETTEELEDVEDQDEPLDLATVGMGNRKIRLPRRINKGA